MSDDKKTAAPATKTETVAPAVAPASTDASATKVSLASRVVERGVLGHAIAPPKAPAQPAGLYEVIHGSVLLGYDGDTEVRVGTGGKAQFTAEEAGPLVAAKVVKLLSAAA